MTTTTTDQQTTPWDPPADFYDIAPTSECLKRLRHDYKNFLKEQVQGIYCVPNNENILTYHALIIGPFDTPYEGGFFVFTLMFPPTYPTDPPFVRYEQTDSGTVRINPNLYKNSKVCLSTLGTRGNINEWTPTQTLIGILLSIQSILNEQPYYNVPVSVPDANKSKNYNDYIRHEVLRINVLDLLLLKPLPTTLFPLALKEVAMSLFPTFLDHYHTVCDTLVAKNGQSLLYAVDRSKFRFDALALQLNTLALHLEKEAEKEEEEEEEEEGKIAA